MYQAPEKKSRSIIAIFTHIHDVMCCSCLFIQKGPIARPEGPYPISTLPGCVYNQPYAWGGGASRG